MFNSPFGCIPSLQCRGKAAAVDLHIFLAHVRKLRVRIFMFDISVVKFLEITTRLSALKENVRLRLGLSSIFR